MENIGTADRILLKPSRAFALADLPRSTGYALIASGEWPSIRIGKAIRIPANGLQEWITRKLRSDSAENNKREE